MDPERGSFGFPALLVMSKPRRAHISDPTSELDADFVRYCPASRVERSAGFLA
jgi:hypothetical protein